MMKNYVELKQAQQERVNNFPMKFAFSNQQLNQILKEWGIDPEDAVERIYSIGAGGYIRKQDAGSFTAMWKELNQELKQAMTDFDFAVDAIYYELGNHEYMITYDIDDALQALMIDQDAIEENPMLKDAIRTAKKKFEEENRMFL